VRCGTGLASDCLLKSGIGNRIRSVDLLDVSSEMLRLASARASGWNVPVTCHQGLVESLPLGSRFELIVVCSVLHHVPDLPAFLGTVLQLQSCGDFFLHLQDPNGDFRLRSRIPRKDKGGVQEPHAAMGLAPQSRQGSRPHSSRANGETGQRLRFANQSRLIEKGLITSPLSVEEMYSITDIHAHDEAGISMKSMRSWMTDHDCISQRSYSFFGKQWCDLPRRYQKLEDDLSARRALNGGEIGAIWRRR
jgi:SAM-dependent methyltransferase